MELISSPSPPFWHGGLDLCINSHVFVGSRIYVYQYDSDAEVPNLQQIKGENGKPWAYKKEPGISTFAGTLETCDTQHSNGLALAWEGWSDWASSRDYYCSLLSLRFRASLDLSAHNPRKIEMNESSWCIWTIKVGSSLYQHFSFLTSSSSYRTSSRR